MPSPSITPVPLIDGFSERAWAYDVILCDIWGVLHNGVAAYAAASDALTRFRSQGGCVILVSNAPRPGPDVVQLLDRFGVTRSAYDGIVTSGDVARTKLSDGTWKRFYWLGPERDGGLFTGLPIQSTTLEDSDVIVCTGLFDDATETPDDYRDFVTQARALQRPMLCANPDLVVERGGELIYCAGAIAALYEEHGGDVLYTGKPYQPIYDAALIVASSLTKRAPDLKRTLMIGDAIRTDVAGATKLGCDSLFVLRGIHTEELGLHEGSLVDGSFAALIEKSGYRPTAAIDRLVW
jgi:HAD superfamily hydrolase (TIGR01459 family)